MPLGVRMAEYLAAKSLTVDRMLANVSRACNASLWVKLALFSTDPWISGSRSGLLTCIP